MEEEKSDVADTVEPLAQLLNIHIKRLMALEQSVGIIERWIEQRESYESEQREYSD